MKKILLFISPLLLLFSACEKPEPLVPPRTIPVGTQTKVFGMGENYENQIWFEFSTQQIHINRHDNWDIAFSCDASQRVLVNGGKNAFFGVARLPGKDFNSFTTLDQSWEFEIDDPSGSKDSLVFSHWCNYGIPGQYVSKDILYLFDLGSDTLGSKRYIKFKLIERNGGVYAFKWGYLKDTVPEVEEYKSANENQNYIYYNFGERQEVFNEPVDKSHWDIVFTTYKELIPDPNTSALTPYVLRGVLSNPNGVRVAEVTGKKTYEDINLSYAHGTIFGESYDEIGYDWKLWSFTANKYTVDQNKIYIVQDSKGDYYKLKFVDFYDDLGRKGYPKMAWELLK